MALQELQAVAPLPGCAPPKVEVLSLDLASLASVRSFCKAFNSKKLPLDILICNAGLMSPPQRLTTQDGLEMQFQVWALLLLDKWCWWCCWRAVALGRGFGRSRAS